jgi:RNA polymerase sigma-70 factor (ECF subfamily)
MPLSSEERTLISKAIKRDPEAFSQLYIRFYEPVLRRVSIVVGDRHDAEDVTSEAFLRAWNAIDRFQDRDVSILAWFVTIAERIAIKQMKNRRPSVDVDSVVLGAAPESSPEVLVQREAELASLKSAIEELPPVQRTVVARRFLEELSYHELGVALGKPVGTVRVIQHRALKALRGILAARGERRAARPVLRSRTPDA